MRVNPINKLKLVINSPTQTSFENLWHQVSRYIRSCTWTESIPESFCWTLLVSSQLKMKCWPVGCVFSGESWLGHTCSNGSWGPVVLKSAPPSIVRSQSLSASEVAFCFELPHSLRKFRNGIWNIKPASESKPLILIFCHKQSIIKIRFSFSTEYKNVFDIEPLKKNLPSLYKYYMASVELLQF